MIEKVVSFGCAWSAGVGLEPGQQSFAELIATRYSVPLDSYAAIGESLESLRHKMISWASTNARQAKKQLILVGLPNESYQTRTVADDVESSKFKIQYNQQPTAYNLELRYKETVYCIAGMLESINAQYLIFNTTAVGRDPHLPNLINGMSMLELLAVRHKPRKLALLGEDKFPTENGHKVIADTLQKHLDSAIIAE